jgi:hypothetical protein
MIAPNLRSGGPRMSTSFPYAARARDVEEAHSALRAASRTVKGRLNPKGPATAKLQASVERFNAALHTAYPAHFWSDMDDLRAGNVRHLETALSFLEADPLFFRSGYTKADVLRVIKRLPLTPGDKTRLRSIVLHRIANRGGREFRHYCHLAGRLDGVGFRASVASLVASDDPAISRRAQWVLSAIDQSRRD